MKTSLAIATIALTFGAMLSFASGVSAQNYGNLSGKMGVSAVQIQAPLPSAPGPRPLSWQSLGVRCTSWPLFGEAGWYSLEATETRNVEVHDR